MPSGGRCGSPSGAALAYDKLVLAAGIRFLWGHPQGYSESAAARMPHAWQAGAQTRLLAAQLAAMRPGGVVAISVPAGPMRCPPGPFERASLMAAYLARRARRAKVLIFDANNHFPRQDAFSAAWQELYPGTIEWIPVTLGGALERVDPERMTLYSSRGAQRADVINIIPPQAPAAIAVQAGLASDHGWCPVEPSTFESTLVPGVHVIGDACIADPMPKAASAAHAQARQCARALAAAFDGDRAAAARDGQRLLQPARAGSGAVHSRALRNARWRDRAAARRPGRGHGERARGGAKRRVVVSAHRRGVVRYLIRPRAGRPTCATPRGRARCSRAGCPGKNSSEVPLEKQ
jgi:hypothetical protein